MAPSIRVMSLRACGVTASSSPLPTSSRSLRRSAAASRSADRSTDQEDTATELAQRATGAATQGTTVLLPGPGCINAAEQASWKGARISEEHLESWDSKRHDGRGHGPPGRADTNCRSSADVRSFAGRAARRWVRPLWCSSSAFLGQANKWVCDSAGQLQEIQDRRAPFLPCDHPQYGGVI
jgi:hypothetical protein